ncbi:MAG: hypothetical protein H6744_20475 [Deltaproteobacteria bacterium]|nr:hypothetical protein [Deltaproteobacteria bacterium]
MVDTAVLAVQSRPPGATVYRGEGDEAEVLCVTPCDDITVAAGEASEVLVLRLDGHLDATLTARLDAGSVFRATTVLDPEPPASSGRSRRAPRAAAPPAEPSSALPKGAASSTSAPEPAAATGGNTTVAPAPSPATAEPAPAAKPRPKLPRLREGSQAPPARKLPGLRTDDAE